MLCKQGLCLSERVLLLVQNASQRLILANHAVETAVVGVMANTIGRGALERRGLRLESLDLLPQGFLLLLLTTVNSPFTRHPAAHSESSTFRTTYEGFDRILFCDRLLFFAGGSCVSIVAMAAARRWSGVAVNTMLTDSLSLTLSGIGQTCSISVLVHPTVRS